jgi:hypothetical protein
VVDYIWWCWRRVLRSIIRCASLPKPKVAHCLEEAFNQINKRRLDGDEQDEEEEEEEEGKECSFTDLTDYIWDLKVEKLLNEPSVERFAELKPTLSQAQLEQLATKLEQQLSTEHYRPRQERVASLMVEVMLRLERDEKQIGTWLEENVVEHGPYGVGKSRCWVKVCACSRSLHMCSYVRRLRHMRSLNMHAHVRHTYLLTFVTNAYSQSPPSSYVYIHDAFSFITIRHA